MTKGGSCYRFSAFVLQLVHRLDRASADADPITVSICSAASPTHGVHARSIGWSAIGFSRLVTGSSVLCSANAKTARW
jgi:hypothetical protein